VGHDPVDLGVAAAAALVGEPARVADAGQDQAVADAVKAVLVAGQPGDRADRARYEQEPVAETGPGLGQHGGQAGGHGDPRAVVVGQRRVADMAADQHLVGGLTLDQVLAVGEVAVGQGGVDADLVVALGQAVGHPLAGAEAPALGVVGGAVGHPVGLVGQGEQVLAQLVQGDRGPHGHAVAHQVQVAVGEVDHPLAVGAGHPGVAHVPLPRHRPVEHLGAGGNLVHLQVELAADDRQGGPDAVTGDAAADRVELGHHREQVLAGGHGSVSG
jgi:hypothetical protein